MLWNIISPPSYVLPCNSVAEAELHDITSLPPPNWLTGLHTTTRAADGLELLQIISKKSLLTAQRRAISFLWFTAQRSKYQCPDQWNNWLINLKQPNEKLKYRFLYLKNKCCFLNNVYIVANCLGYKVFIYSKWNWCHEMNIDYRVPKWMFICILHQRQHWVSVHEKQRQGW